MSSRHIDYAGKEFAVGDLFSLAHGIATGALRRGVAKGGYIAYVETAGVGSGFQYFVIREGIRVREGTADDFLTAKAKS